MVPTHIVITMNAVERLRKNFRRPSKVLRLLKALARKSLFFSDISRIARMDDSLTNYYLSRLLSLGIVEKTDLGTYALRIKVPFCYLEDEISEYTYLGLLGRRHYHEEPETKTATNILGGKGYNIVEIKVITTRSAVDNWSSEVIGDYDLVIVDEKDIVSISSMEDVITGILERLILRRPVIMDCTSLTKPATIAMYNVARRYLVPLIYVYEADRQIHWIITQREIRDCLCEMFPESQES